MILSDGWDTGEPAELAAALAELKRRAGTLIWLNPLLGSATYQPLVRGMQAALHFYRRFRSLNNLASLRALEQHLVLWIMKAEQRRGRPVCLPRSDL